jgi:hypothetical protein
MCCGGFWSKILVPNGQWEIILKRIRHKDIPNAAISSGGFWSKILVPNGQWEIIFKRICEDNIPDQAIVNGGFWSKILGHPYPMGAMGNHSEEDSR